MSSAVSCLKGSELLAGTSASTIGGAVGEGALFVAFKSLVHEILIRKTDIRRTGIKSFTLYLSNMNSKELRELP